MARGQAAAADQQLATTNAVAQQEGAQANNLQQQVLPKYQSLYDNPLSPEQQQTEQGYTSLMDTGYMNPEEATAATTSEMGAATAPFQAAQFGAANRAAATNNASDLTAQQDQLALEEGQTAGTAAAGLQKEKMSNELQGSEALTNLGQQRIANQEAAMYGIGGIASEDLNAQNSMYGLGPGTLNARAAGQSDLQQIGGALGGAASFIGAVK